MVSVRLLSVLKKKILLIVGCLIFLIAYFLFYRVFFILSHASKKQTGSRFSINDQSFDNGHADVSLPPKPQILDKVS